jgi:hypothetical protein
LSSGSYLNLFPRKKEKKGKAEEKETKDIMVERETKEEDGREGKERHRAST